MAAITKLLVNKDRSVAINNPFLISSVPLKDGHDKISLPYKTLQTPVASF